jgi:hypothetical protein
MGRRGLASMSAEKRRAIASMGGRACHVLGKAHEWTSVEAAVAGRAGVAARRAKKLARDNESAV